MKGILIGIFGLLVTSAGHAQTFAEWFQQNSTRLKYYAQQVAELQLTVAELEKAYKIADAGLGAIGGSKQAEFDLHNDYYASLGTINPAVGGLGEAAEIVVLQAAIIRRFTDALSNYRQNGGLRGSGLAYVEQVYSNVVQAGIADITILTNILTPGIVELTDDQRMGRITELDATMRDRYRFTLAFTDRTDLLQSQIAAQEGEIGSVRALYGIP